MAANRTTLVLFLAVFLMMVGVGMIVALLPRHYSVISGAPHTVGALAAAFALAYTAVQFPAGRLADRYGITPFLVAGYLVCALAGLGFYFSRSGLAILAGRFVQGLGEAPVWSLAPAVLALANPGREGRVIGSYNAVLHLGLTIGPGLGLLIGRFLPQETVFVVYAVLCGAGGLLLARFPVKAAGVGAIQRQPRNFRALVPILRRPAVLATFLAAAVYGAGYGTGVTLVPIYLLEAKGATPGGVGLYFTGFYLALGTALFLTGPAIDRWGHRKFTATGMLVAGAGMAGLTLAHGPTLAGMALLGSFGLGILGTGSLTSVNRAAPEDLRGTFSGAYYLAWGVGMFGGPLAIGGLEAAAGAGMGLLTWGLLMGVCGVVLVRVGSGRGGEAAETPAPE